MKILVLGSNGMAGHMISKYLKATGYQVETLAKNNADFSVDIENLNESKAFFCGLQRYDFIINCIGLLVKDSQQNQSRAIYINSFFPHFLEETFANTHTRIIHLSTDCVFDGSDGPYIEQSPHTELNNYGKSKSLGEVINNKDITFRMSIIGPEIKNGSGLFNFIYNNPKKDIPGWENAWWNGITTLQLAKCINEYIANPSIVGVYHLVNNEVSINKFELLCLINKIFNLQKHIIKSQGPKTINKILVDTRKQFNFNIPNYDIQLSELKEFMIYNEEKQH